ncbi:dihydrofolate reductase [Paenibacillus sp. CAU 1782]
MSVTMIAAMDINRTIGIHNELPWRLPAEMAYFKEKTMGKTVLMGRKTFQTLRKPLEGRVNAVLTRGDGSGLAGCEIVQSADEALQKYAGDGIELMVAGGAEIYHLFLPHADKILLTVVDTDIPGGDAFFPALDAAEWKITGSQSREIDDNNPYSFTFYRYERA